MGTFMAFFAAGLTVAIISGMPPWLITLLVIGLLISVVWYNVNARWHNQRTVSGEGLDDNLDEADVEYLTERESFENQFCGAHHVPRSEVARLYDRNSGH